MRAWIPRAMLSLGLLGCDMGFERQSQIARVRVLAVKATPPEWTVPKTGGGVAQLSANLEAFVVTPDGKAPSVRFALCKFGNPYEVGFECPGKDGLDLPTAQLSLLDPAVQAFTNLPVEAGPPGTPPGAFLPDSLSFFVGYEADDGSGLDTGKERGVVQFNFRKTDAPNQNPLLLDLLKDGASLVGPLKVSEEVSVTPVVSADSRETFTGPDGALQREPMGYSWYATGNGTLQYLRTQTLEGEAVDNSFNTYTAAEAPEEVTFHVVARDGRGGVSFLSRTVKVE